MTAPRPVPLTVAGAVGLALMLGLSGCFASPFGTSGSGSEPSSTQSPDSSSPDDSGSDSPDHESGQSATEKAKDIINGMLDDIMGDEVDGDTSFHVGAGLPSGFPTSVPVPDLDIVMSSKIPSDEGSTSWQVTFASDDIARDFDAQVRALKAAGFSEGFSGSFASLDTTIYTDDDYGVTLSAVQGDGHEQGTLMMVVLPADMSE